MCIEPSVRHLDENRRKRLDQLRRMSKEDLMAEWASKPRFQGMTPPRVATTLIDGIMEAERTPSVE